MCIRDRQGTARELVLHLGTWPARLGLIPHIRLMRGIMSRFCGHSWFSCDFLLCRSGRYCRPSWGGFPIGALVHAITPGRSLVLRRLLNFCGHEKSRNQGDCQANSSQYPPLAWPGWLKTSTPTHNLPPPEVSSSPRPAYIEGECLTSRHALDCKSVVAQKVTGAAQ